ncbi:hypothetical protein SK128_016850 [Halocaridina rubra]|uniref:Uncharacterized protein n=1 Tax=Halocaridina rubra TaxID=373956 RepID=A0AAN8ZVM2_HALRR
MARAWARAWNRMRRKGFQEVALSLTEPGSVVHDENIKRVHLQPLSSSLGSLTSVNTYAVSRASIGTEKLTQQRLYEDPDYSHPHSAAAHSRPIVRQVSRQSLQPTRITSRRLQQLRNTLSRSSSVSTLHDSETDSADFESAPVEDQPRQQAAPATSTSALAKFVVSVRRKARNVGRTVASASRSALSSGRSSSESSGSAVQSIHQVRPLRSDMEKINVEQRIDGWQAALKAAIDKDTHGQYEEALMAYDRAKNEYLGTELWRCLINVTKKVMSFERQHKLHHNKHFWNSLRNNMGTSLSYA